MSKGLQHPELLSFQQRKQNRALSVTQTIPDGCGPSSDANISLAPQGRLEWHLLCNAGFFSGNNVLEKEKKTAVACCWLIFQDDWRAILDVLMEIPNPSPWRFQLNHRANRTTIVNYCKRVSLTPSISKMALRLSHSGCLDPNNRVTGPLGSS
jgi:hypothetical protein